jgi:hypothetical protein
LSSASGLRACAWPWPLRRVRLKRRVQKGPAAVASFTVRSRQLHRQRLAQESKADARGHVNHDCSRIIVLAQSPRMHEAVMILLPQLRAPSARGAQLHDFSALERTGPWRKLDPVPRGWISTETRLTILRVLSLSLSLSLFPTPSNPCAHGCLTMHNAGITVDAQQRAASLPFPPLGRSEVALSDESGLGRPLTQRDRCKDPRSHGRDHLTMGPGPKVESCHARRAADLVKPYAPQRLGRADKIYAVICMYVTVSTTTQQHFSRPWLAYADCRFGRCEVSDMVRDNKRRTLRFLGDGLAVNSSSCQAF